MIVNRNITWNDGTQEQVSIDENAVLRINGVQTNLVGVCFNRKIPSGTTATAFYTKLLDWMQSKGFRTVQYELNPGYSMASNATFFDLCKQRKMLVTPLLSTWWFMPVNLTPANFAISTSYPYVQDFFTQACAFLNNYSNVITVFADNEVDLSAKSNGGISNSKGAIAYTATAARDYMAFITPIIKNFNWTNGRPAVSTKVVTLPVTQAFQTACRNYFLPYVDFISLDTYADTAYGASYSVQAALSQMRTSLTANGYPASKMMWQGEFSAHQGGVESAFTPDFLKAAVAGGSLVNDMFTSYESTGNPMGFFNDDGTPKQSMINVAAELSNIQGGTAPPATTNITFAGSMRATVSGAVMSGKTVTLDVTKPDNTTESFTATTDTSGNYSVVKAYPAGTYSAKANYAGDVTYNAVTSPTANFTVGKTDLTLVINIG